MGTRRPRRFGALRPRRSSAEGEPDIHLEFRCPRKRGAAHTGFLAPFRMTAPKTPSPVSLFLLPPLPPSHLSVLPCFRDEPDFPPHLSLSAALAMKKISFGAGKPDSVPRLAALRSSFLSRASRDAPGLRRDCSIPATIGRAAQPPILPCTGWGFSCRRHR